MMLQGRQSLASPIFHLRIVAALGVSLEQRNGIFMGADLHSIILRRKILRFNATKFVKLALRSAIEGGRYICFVAAADHGFELRTSFRMVGDHLLGKFLFLGISLLL